MRGPAGIPLALLLKGGGVPAPGGIITSIIGAEQVIVDVEQHTAKTVELCMGALPKDNFIFDKNIDIGKGLHVKG